MDDSQRSWTLQPQIAHLFITVPVAPEEGVHVVGPETIPRLGKLALEGQSAHLAVGNHLQARSFLQPDSLIHSAILDRFEFGAGDGAKSQVLPGFQQLRGAEKTANN